MSDTRVLDQGPTEDSAAKHRAKQTLVNLVLALVASLGIVLLTVLAVPRDDSNRITPVDYKKAVAEAKASSGLDIFAPEIPQGWWANQAKWFSNPADGVKYFQTGFVGPNNQYVRLTQAFSVNPTWVALSTKEFGPNIDAIATNSNWTKWIHTGQDDADPYLWTLEDGSDLIILNGTHEKDFPAFANVIENEVN